MLSSYKVIKSININHDEEKSVITTKINLNSDEVDFMAEKSIVIVSDENGMQTLDIDRMEMEIHNQLRRENEVERAKMIENTMIEAEVIKAQANKHGQELGLKQGYEQGYKQGYKEGLQVAKNESIEIRNNALNMVEQAERNIDEYFKTNKTNIINLAAEMAESIIHSEIDGSSDNILMIINPILQQYGKKGNITISCHPNNIGNLKEHLNQLQDNYPDSKFILFEDGNLEINGCIIENKTQIIDLQIKKQLDSIIEDIKEI